MTGTTIEENQDVKVYAEDRFVIIESQDIYEVPLDGCKDENSIIGWIIQLCEKSWVDRRIIRKFIATISKENNIIIRGYENIRH